MAVLQTTDAEARRHTPEGWPALPQLDAPLTLLILHKHDRVLKLDLPHSCLLSPPQDRAHLPSAGLGGSRTTRFAKAADDLFCDPAWGALT